MKNKSIFLIFCLTTLLVFNNSYGQNFIPNTNQRNNQSFIGNKNIQNINYSNLISNASKNNKIEFINNYEKLFLSQDSNKLVKKFYDSVMGKSKSTLDSLDPSKISGFIKRWLFFINQGNDYNTANRFAKKYVDSFFLSENYLSPDAKAQAFTDSTNSLFQSVAMADSILKVDSLNAVKKNWLQAAEFVKTNQSVVKNFLQIFIQNDTAATNQIKDLNSNNPTIKNISYILLALQDTSDINSYFSSLNNLNFSKDDTTDIRIKMDDIIRIVSKLTAVDRHHFSLFASGDFLSTIQSSSVGSNNSILSGTVGINCSYKKTSFFAKVILVSNQDTVINNYGTQILVPAKGKGFGTLVLGDSYKLSKTSDSINSWDLNMVASFSSQHWRLDSSQLNNLDSINSNMDSTFNKSATIAGLDLTLSYTFNIKDSMPVGNNNYPLSLKFNLGAAARFLGGDVLKPLQNKNSVLAKTGYYSNRFPTTRTAFFGGELGASINVGPITAEFEVYYFPSSSKDKLSLNGLTGLQAAFGASINLSIFHK